MDNKYDKIQAAASYIEQRLGKPVQGRLAIVLGTGLGDLVSMLEYAQKIPYADIPHFPQSTVQSHSGELHVGELYGQQVVLLAGRFHYYEGYSAAELTFPVYVLRALGITTYLATNVTGGINPDYEAGDIVMVSDHINLHPDHPLRGSNDERLGPRFPDMMEAYDPTLRQQMMHVADEQGTPLHQGVYVGLQGPSLETPAEYRFCRIIGGDLIGMSTVPEVIVANHCGMQVAVLSIVSNVCYPLDRLTKTTVEEVIAVAEKATPKLSALVLAWVEHYGNEI